MDGQLFTWDSLAAMSGASILTFFFVQYTKRLIDRAFSIPTDLYAVFVAFLVLLAAQLALGANPADWRVYGLAFANAFLVAAAAGQVHSKAIQPPGMSETKGSGEDANQGH